MSRTQQKTNSLFFGLNEKTDHEFLRKLKEFNNDNVKFGMVHYPYFKLVTDKYLTVEAHPFSKKLFVVLGKKFNGIHGPREIKIKMTVDEFELLQKAFPLIKTTIAMIQDGTFPETVHGEDRGKKYCKLDLQLGGKITLHVQWDEENNHSTFIFNKSEENTIFLSAGAMEGLIKYITPLMTAAIRSWQNCLENTNFTQCLMTYY